MAVVHMCICVCVCVCVPRLRDDDRKDPKVLAHLTAENTYTEAVMADTKELQVCVCACVCVCVCVCAYVCAASLVCC